MNQEMHYVLSMQSIQERVLREGVIVIADNKVPDFNIIGRELRSGGFYRLENAKGGGINWDWFPTVEEASRPSPDAVEAAIQCGA